MKWWMLNDADDVDVNDNCFLYFRTFLTKLYEKNTNWWWWKEGPVYVSQAKALNAFTFLPVILIFHWWI